MNYLRANSDITVQRAHLRAYPVQLVIFDPPITLRAKELCRVSYEHSDNGVRFIGFKVYLDPIEAVLDGEIPECWVGNRRLWLERWEDGKDTAMFMWSCPSRYCYDEQCACVKLHGENIATLKASYEQDSTLFFQWQAKRGRI